MKTQYDNPDEVMVFTDFLKENDVGAALVAFEDLSQRDQDKILAHAMAVFIQQLPKH
jgi:fibrillarin-like rRNA methylase